MKASWMGALLIALSVPAVAAAAPGELAVRERLPCGQPRIGNPVRPMLVAPLPPPAPGAPKAERDPLLLPNSLVSANFRLAWGNTAPFDTADAMSLLTSLEHSWTVEIDELGHPAPMGTEGYLFNVYAGSSGDGAPESNGVAGYYNLDEEGYPMLVIDESLIAEGGTYVEGTAAHEFYHAVQGSTARYSYEGLGAWFWEATATWVMYQVYPDHPDYATFLFGYAFLPHYSANYFDYFDTGRLEEYHQYGAFVFPHYLTEQVADPSLVRDAWLDPGTEPDPMVVMGELLGARGLDLHEVWLDHVAHDVLWDYEDHENLRAYAEAYVDDYEESANVVVAQVSALGTDGFVLGPESATPRRYGSNTIRIATPAPGNLRVRVHGVADGFDDSPAFWGARVVREFADHIEYESVPFELQEFWEGELLVEGVGDEQALWLVVGTWTADPAPETWMTEQFPFEYEVTPEEVEPAGTTGDTTGAVDTSGGESSTGDADDESTGAPADTGSEESSSSSTAGEARGDDDGCGCSNAPPRGSGALALLLLGLRRRRKA